MWPLLSACVDESVVVSLDDAAAAMRFAAERCHIVVEGAAACAIAAARTPAIRDRHRRIVVIVSGGNIDLSRFASLTGACTPT
jgi:threonine dehydratase